MQLDLLIKNIDTACNIMQAEAIRSVSSNKAVTDKLLSVPG